MALTDIEKQLIKKMIADGKTDAEIPALLAKAKEKLGLDTATTQAPQQSGLGQFMDTKAGLEKDVVTGALKGVGEFAKNFGLGAVGLGDKANPVRADIEQKVDPYLETEGKLEGGVKTATEVASGLALGSPLTGGLRAAGATQAANMGLGKLGQAVAGNLAASPLETALVSESIQGEAPTGKELGIGAAIDAIIPFASKGLEIGGNLLKKAGDLYKTGGVKFTPMTQDVIETVGKSGDDVKRTFTEMSDQYGQYMKNQTELSSPMADVGNTAYKDFTENLVPEKQGIGKQIGDYVKKFSDETATGNAVDFSAVQKQFDDTLEGMNIKPILNEDTGAKSLDFSDSGIRFSDSTQKEINKVYSNLQSIGNTASRGDAWYLYKSIDDLLGGLSPTATQITKSGEVPLISLKNTLKDKFLEGAPEDLSKLYSQYSELSDAVNYLNKRFGDAGQGEYAIVKSLFGEQKYGEEVKKALKTLSKLTGVNYLELARMAKAAGEIAGDAQVESLLNLTSKKGLIDTIATEFLTDRNKVINQIKEQLNGKDIKISQDKLETIVNAVLKTLNVTLD